MSTAAVRSSGRCDGQMTMAAKCRHAAKYARGSGMRNGREACDSGLIDERARQRRPGFDRLDIYSSRDHPFSSQEGGAGGGEGGGRGAEDTSLLLRLFVTWFARRKSLRNGNGSFPVGRDEYTSINGEWIFF